MGGYEHTDMEGDPRAVDSTQGPYVDPAPPPPPDEPGLVSEGIGPLGLLIGGIEGGVEGVVHAAIGEGLIGGTESLIDHFRDVEPTQPPAIDLPTDEETTTRSTWTEHDS
jgi:hypothetical protein